MLVAHELSLLMTILNLDQWNSEVFSFFTLSCSILPYILSFLLFTIHSIIFTIHSIILTICSIIFAIFTIRSIIFTIHSMILAISTIRTRWSSASSSCHAPKSRKRCAALIRSTAICSQASVIVVRARPSDSSN